MIKRIAIRKDGTISMSEFRKYAEKSQGEINELEEENKKLNEKVRFLEEYLDRKEKLNESYRKEIKDHQLYEEKLEHRIIEFEELLHGE